MQVVGVYLRTLRDLEAITQKKAGDRIGVASKTVERWEAGENEPPMTTLQSYVAALHGSVLRVTALLLDAASATEEQARAAARKDWKARPSSADEERILMAQLASLTGQRRQLAEDLLQQLLTAEEHAEEP